MSNTDLSTLISPPTDPRLSGNHGKTELADDVKLEAILSLAELIEKGTRSTGAIMAWLASQNLPASRPTAIKYRNLAMTLIARESKPMNRENMRALEQGRLIYWIEWWTTRIDQFKADMPDAGAEDYLKWQDSLTKMLSKLTELGARLHAITGLNEITINTNERPKRIVFLRPGVESPTDGSDKPMSHNTPTPITEGEVIEASPSH